MSGSPERAFTVRRLQAGDEALAIELFATMAAVFDEPFERLSLTRVGALLAQPTFWAIAAVAGEQIVGGLTAHTLPMTRAPRDELFLFDVAVQPAWQRRGVGRALVDTLRAEGARAGIDDVFVAADDEDTHALDFYRALGGESAPVTIFTFDGSTGRRF